MSLERDLLRSIAAAREENARAGASENARRMEQMREMERYARESAERSGSIAVVVDELVRRLDVGGKLALIARVANETQYYRGRRVFVPVVQGVARKWLGMLSDEGETRRLRRDYEEKLEEQAGSVNDPAMMVEHKGGKYYFGCVRWGYQERRYREPAYTADGDSGSGGGYYFSTTYSGVSVIVGPGPCIVVQDDVMQNLPRQGWETLGGYVEEHLASLKQRPVSHVRLDEPTEVELREAILAAFHGKLEGVRGYRRGYLERG